MTLTDWQHENFIATEKMVSHCTNCGKLNDRTQRAGLCKTCSNYQHRTGEMRPERLWNRVAFCIRCKINEITAKELCPACYDYDRVNGKARPMHLRNPDWLCSNPHCRKPKVVGQWRGRYCEPCYQYRLLHNDQNRPGHLSRNICTEGYEPCANPNCDKPLVIGRANGILCHGCKKYEKENRVDRPRRLCAKANLLGWCECGQIAEKELTWEYKVVARISRTTSAMCLECFEMDQKWAA